MEIKKAKKIIDEIIDSLCSRSGLDGAWEGIDTEIQDEIKKEWLNIILKECES